MLHRGMPLPCDATRGANWNGGAVMGAYIWFAVTIAFEFFKGLVLALRPLHVPALTAD